MRSAKQAAEVYRKLERNRVGMCLWHVQEAFNAPHLYPSAIAQWNAAKTKHTGRDIPYGAPVYFRGGRYGHIAIYVGNGKVRSSDAGGSGRMATVPLDWFQQHWGYPYIGWSEDIGGQRIDFDDKIEVHVSKLKPGVDDSDSVRELRYRLIKRDFLKVEKPLSLDKPGNKYTPAVKKAVAKWQRKKGYADTGVFNNRQAKEFFQNVKKVRVIPE